LKKSRLKKSVSLFSLFAMVSGQWGSVEMEKTEVRSPESGIRNQDGFLPRALRLSMALRRGWRINRACWGEAGIEL
jgi:hypothetical protein